MKSTTITLTSELRERFNDIKKLTARSPQKALSEYENLIALAIQEQDFHVQVDSQIQAASLFRKQGLFYKALRNAGSALQLINHHFPSDKFRMALSCKELGVIYADGLKKYSVALGYFFKAINCDVPELKSILLNNIGSLYKDSKLYKKAKKYLVEGQKLAEREDDKNIYIFILENLGRVYTAQGDYDEAVKVLKEALNVSKEALKTNQSIHYIRGYVMNALAEIYLETNRSGEAIYLIEEALAVAKEKNNMTVIIECLKNKGSYGLRRGNVDLFFESINKAIAYTEDENLVYEKDHCLELLKDYYWSQEMYKEACEVSDQIIQHKMNADKTHESISMADVLEQRESEIMILEEKNRKISQQKDELEQFAYIVAHDLKEPLRNIGNYSGLIQRRYEDVIDEEGGEFINFIMNNATHMYKMLEDLLQYATLRGEDHSINTSDPKIILNNIIYRIKDKLNETNTQIKFIDLPPLNIRPIHLDILFDNLIKNAIKFRSPDRPLVIEITATELESHFCFVVKDNGKGISPAYHETIFQIFKRLDKVNYSGTGIGLSVCKKIVETYRGKIWVESEMDQGASFHFTIRKGEWPK